MSISMWTITILTVFLVTLTTVRGRNKSPLLDDDVTRMRNKAAECVFGNQIRELGSSWVPDLGGHIGVLYCMKCECVPMQRKKRIMARVVCRSIKNECPKLTCTQPVVYPGRCCKTCPGDLFDENFAQDKISQSTLDEDDRTGNHYAAILNSRSPVVIRNDLMIPIPVLKNIAATGRFTFAKKSLQFSIFVSDKIARPQYLQFADPHGNILEEFQLENYSNSPYQMATGKICGIWHRVPRDYKKLLKQEKLFAVLLWGHKDKRQSVLTGQIIKHVALESEMFSSLLELPNVDSSSGTAAGTAIISISNLAGAQSMHITIIFNGLFSSNDTIDSPVQVTVTHEDDQHQIATLIEDQIIVSKPSYDINIIKLNNPLSANEFRLLTRARLRIKVSSTSDPIKYPISGAILANKLNCELFQASLTSFSPPNSSLIANPHGVAGVAWLYISNEGSLVYNIQITQLRSDEMPISITLVDTGSKRNVDLEDLTPYYNNGWANGTIDRITIKLLQPLINGQLAINVATQNLPTLIRGKLMSRVVADAVDSPAPFLLKRENYTLSTAAVAMAWISVDIECHLLYDVTLTGLNVDDELQLYLEQLPMLAPGAPVISRHLADFERGNNNAHTKVLSPSTHVEGSPLNSLSKEEITRLDSGIAFLKVKDKNSQYTLLSGTIEGVAIPNNCRPKFTDNNIPTLIFDRSEDEPSGECFYEGKFYQEGAQWTSSIDPCTTCFCQNGQSKCDTMVCPIVDCPVTRIRPIGECCPLCPTALNAISGSSYNVTRGTKCLFNGKSYTAGSVFHPFLIPNGFDTCTECICDSTQLEIKCVRKQNERNCCKYCKDHSLNATFYSDDANRHPMTTNMAGSKSGKDNDKMAQQILNEGGCRNLHNPNMPYTNGSQYHPSIHSLGEYKCVTCVCLNGNQTCKRQECDKVSCERLMLAKRKGGLSHAGRVVHCCPLRCRKFRHKKTAKAITTNNSTVVW